MICFPIQNKSYRTQEQSCPEQSLSIPQNDRYLLIFQRWAVAPSVLFLNKVFFIFQKSIVLLLFLILGASCIHLEPSMLDASKKPAALIASILPGSTTGAAGGTGTLVHSSFGAVSNFYIAFNFSTNLIYVGDCTSDIVELLNPTTGAYPF